MLWQPQLFYGDNNNNSFIKEEKLNEKPSTPQLFEVKQQKKLAAITVCKPWFKTVALYFFGNKSALFGIFLNC